MPYYALVDQAGLISDDTFVFSFPYLSQDDIHVYLDGVEELNFTFSADYTILLDTPLVANATVRIKRVTPISTAAVDFVNGAVLGETDMDTAGLQLLYAMQETADAQANNLQTDDDGNYDALTQRIVNLGTPTATTDAVTKAYCDTLQTAAVAAVDAQQTTSVAAVVAQQVTSVAAVVTQEGTSTTAINLLVADAEAAQVAAEAAQAAAEAARNAAQTAETNAELAETNAETAEVNAELAETNAEAAQAAAEAAAASIATAYRAVATTDSLVSTDRTIALSGASFTFTLTTAVGNSGRIVDLIHLGTSLTQVYTIATTSSQTIDGTTTYLLYTNGERVSLVSDGANWQLLAHRAETLWANAGAMTITATTSNPTKPTTPDIDQVWWRRSGKSCFLRFILQISSSAGGAAGSGAYLFLIPGSLSIASAAPVDPVATAYATATMSEGIKASLHGSGRIVIDSTSLDLVHPVAYDTTHLMITRSTSSAPVGSATYDLTTAEMGFFFEVEFPEANWRL